MNTNGWLVGPAFAKWAIGSLLAIGVWVGTIQATIGDKADKLEIATQTQILIRIEEKLDDVKDSVKDLDKRQRDISKDVAELKAKSE